MWPAGPCRLLIVLAGSVALASCREPPPDLTGLGAERAFTEAVIPVLREQCEGCHFPGGSMYAEMPFDDIEVVGGLEDQMRARLEGRGREVVDRWLELLRREGGDAAAENAP